MKLEKQVRVIWRNLHLFFKNVGDLVKTLEQMGTELHLRKINVESAKQDRLERAENRGLKNRQ